MSDLKRRTVKVDAVYDLETEGWAKFLVGAIRHKDGTYNVYDWRKEKGLYQEISAVEGNVWAHNGGVFDHKWWLQEARAGRTNVQVSAAGGRIVRLQSGALSLLDSKALSKLSLAAFSQGVGVSKSAHGLDCLSPERCGPGCGGYCRFHRKMRRSDMEKVHSYLRDDCESLYQSMERLSEWGETHDLDLCPTIGGSSWASASRLLGLPDASLSLSDHEFARQGYYGGRAQIFRPVASAGHEYDVNALYPSALETLELPVGIPWRRFGQAARRAYRDGHPGVVHADVAVPEMWIPPLPVRCAERNAYPTGVFEGAWTALELEYAESVGVKVLDIKEGLFWPEKRNVFRPWVQKLWSLRATAQGGKSGPFGTFLKFYMNSLTGKLGMHPASKRYVVCPKEIKDHYEQIGREVFSYDGPQVRKNRDGKRVAGAPCCHVEWAAYLTAYGRIQWHRQASSGRDRDLVMGDTDSVLAISERTINVGSGLGQWQYKGAFKDFRAMAPKFYTLTRVGKGEPEFKSKGVRGGSPDAFRELFSSGRGTFHWNSSRGFRDSARREGSLFDEAQTTRTIRQGYGDRILDGDCTRPPMIKEALA